MRNHRRGSRASSQDAVTRRAALAARGRTAVVNRLLTHSAADWELGDGTWEANMQSPGRQTNGSAARGVTCRKSGRNRPSAATSRFMTSRCATASSRPPSSSAARRRSRSRRSSTALGIHRIEAGMPAVSRAGQGRHLRHRRAGTEGRDLRLRPLHPGGDQGRSRRAAAQGVVDRDSRQRPHDQERLRLAVERAMKASIDTTLAAKEAGLYTVFFTIDATRTELNRFLDIVEQVATEGHMDALTIADTMGVCTPDAVSHVGEEGDRSAEEAGRDPLPPGLRARRREHASPRWPPAPRWRTRRSPASASGPATCRWKTS